MLLDTEILEVDADILAALAFCHSAAASCVSTAHSGLLPSSQRHQSKWIQLCTTAVKPYCRYRHEAGRLHLLLAACVTLVAD